jgi:hypothetical protein
MMMDDAFLKKIGFPGRLSSDMRRPIATGGWQIIEVGSPRGSHDLFQLRSRREEDSEEVGGC